MKSSLRDAETGQLLPFDRVALRASLKPTLLRTGVPPELAQEWIDSFPSALDDLLYYVRVQRRDEFDKVIFRHREREPRPTVRPSRTEPAYSFAAGPGPGGGEIYRDGLWVALSEFQSRAEFQLAVVTLCDPDNRRGPFGCADIPPLKRPPPEKDDKAKAPASGTTIYTTIQTTTTPPAK